MNDDATKAALFKQEGNALFTKHEYSAAYHKYTEAIQCDDKNAILYANRAACSLSMSQYLDASSDARKATNLDPGYAKGWARLAMAHRGLGKFDESIECWATATAALPTENMTASELKQKEQYATELQSTISQKARRNAPPNLTVMKDHAAGSLPWQRAKSMRTELESNPALLQSSAWVISGALGDWERGMEQMKQLQVKQVGAQVMYGGYMGALGELSNAVLRNSRIFHIADHNWVEMYNNQVKFEAQKSRAWTEGGSRIVIAEAQERQKKEGWDSVRPAIATTIRAWVMRGLIESNISNRTDVAMEYFTCCLEVLEWGNQTWKNVSTEDKGAVFKPTFIRGVRGLRLEAMMENCTGKSGSDARRPLSDLLEEAEYIIRELESPLGIPSGEIDPGFLSSSYIYPKAQAFAMVGFYHNQMARLCAALKDTAEAIVDHLQKAAKAYLTAADLLPEDDEIHVWYIHCSLEALFRCGTPIKVILPLLKRVRLVIPKMKKIWEHSAMAHQGRDQSLEQDLWAEEDIQKALDEGKFTMDDKVMPEVSK